MDVTVISDGIRTVDKPNETFGTNQKPEDVAALLTAHFLPTDKFVNGFSPVLVKTGSDLILFDTGMGERRARIGVRASCARACRPRDTSPMT